MLESLMIIAIAVAIGSFMKSHKSPSQVLALEPIYSMTARLKEKTDGY